MAQNQLALKDLPDTQDPISAVRFSPTNPSRLLVGSWDRSLYLFDTHAEKGGKLVNKIEHRAVILDCCWSDDDNVAFTCGNDYDVRKVNLTTGEQTVLSTHEAPAARLAFDSRTMTLFSISWACELHVQPVAKEDGIANTAAKLRLPAKPLAIAVSGSKLVIAMANRSTQIFDTNALSVLARQSSQDPPNEIQAEPWQNRDASLKFMTIAVDCMPNDTGYATASIEGRVAVDWFDPSPESQSRKFAFKCHRETISTNDDNGEPCEMDIVHPVHALAFNPVYGTFCSGGQDGTVALWDAVSKRRIRMYNKLGNSVKSLGWNCTGNLLAIGICPGLESDGAGGEKWTEGPVSVLIREMAEGEATAKAKK